MKNLKYKYRLYPTDNQIQLMHRVSGCQRFVWNYFLNQEKEYYKITHNFKYYYTNSKDLPSLKKQISWLKDAPSVSLQETLRNLDKALKQSFSKNVSKKGFPKFKKKRNHIGSFTLTTISQKSCISKNHFYIPKIGNVKCIYHRELCSDFKSATIKQEAGKWFVVIACTKPKLPKREINTHTGVDLNGNAFVTPQNIYNLVKPLRENQTKIKAVQQKMARCQKGSKNKQALQLKLQRINQYVTNVRLDYFHKLSKSLIDQYDLITIEDLDVKGIQGKFGKLIQDNGFGLFRQMLTYKCELYGAHLVVANRYFPSSQICSCCGHKTKMLLSERTYVCKSCNFTIDRDVNAAINLDSLGVKSLLGVERAKVMAMDVLSQYVNVCNITNYDNTNEVAKINQKFDETRMQSNLDVHRAAL